MVVAIEDSGFEIRDMVSWISNKTFPKSMDVSKAIDKAAGAERKVVGSASNGVKGLDAMNLAQGKRPQMYKEEKTYNLTEPATHEAKMWAGWGTALKPTVEPIVMARKPLDGTVANNVLTWGVGGLNIDGSRIAGEIQSVPQPNTKGGVFSGEKGRTDLMSDNTKGRWPANVILDEEAATIVDEQSGTSKPKPERTGIRGGKKQFDGGWNKNSVGTWVADPGGGASRFFYVARASKNDRNEGVEENPHPTVKPTSLMTYLIKLVAPEGSTILDPFTGSGSTGKAALLNGYKFIGIELTEEYLPIIKGRLDHAEETYKQTKEQESGTLF
jgi:site-specific DNA-methyltransferase (adenine-specific)